MNRNTFGGAKVKTKFTRFFDFYLRSYTYKYGLIKINSIFNIDRNFAIISRPGTRRPGLLPVWIFSLENVHYFEFWKKKRRIKHVKAVFFYSPPKTLYIYICMSLVWYPTAYAPYVPLGTALGADHTKFICMQSNIVLLISVAYSRWWIMRTDPSRGFLNLWIII